MQFDQMLKELQTPDLFETRYGWTVIRNSLTEKPSFYVITPQEPDRYASITIMQESMIPSVVSWMLNGDDVARPSVDSMCARTRSRDWMLDTEEAIIRKLTELFRKHVHDNQASSGQAE